VYHDRLSCAQQRRQQKVARAAKGRRRRKPIQARRSYARSPSGAPTAPVSAHDGEVGTISASEYVVRTPNDVSIQTTVSLANDDHDDWDDSDELSDDEHLSEPQPQERSQSTPSTNASGPTPAQSQAQTVARTEARIHARVTQWASSCGGIEQMLSTVRTVFSGPLPTAPSWSALGPNPTDVRREYLYVYALAVELQRKRL
jgi:hypothetical protein